MIFNVKNLGYIEDVSVDLNKDLIVLTGQNNTGKTYLAYAIYALLNIKYISLDLEEDDILIDEDNDVVISIDGIFKEKHEEIGNELSWNLKRDISNFFSINDKILKNVEFEITFDDIDFDKSHSSVFFDKEEDETIKNVLDNASDYFSTQLFSKLLPRTYIAPAERNAINIFSKELSLTKSKLFRNGNATVKNAQFVNRYPKPIQDNLEIAEDLAFLSKNKSEFEYLAIELEQDFLKGKITTNQYGQIEYQPDNQKDINLEIHLTASMVKSLSNIVFYLRHLAQKGDCIIIDEPELNLHPDNQRKIARFIGRLINEGFQVVISTHSDYIVKELNNMIMLSKAKNDNQALIEKLSFRGDELLEPEQVQALLFTLNSRKPVDIAITAEGFEVATINEVIEQQDNDMETIYFELFQKVM